MLFSAWWVAVVCLSHCKEPLLYRVRVFILPGWSNYMKDEMSMPYFSHGADLSVDHVSYRGCMCSYCIARESGICQVKSAVRCYLWWPNLDSNTEKTIPNYGACQSVHKLPTVTPLHCWKLATRVWQKLHVDFAENSRKVLLNARLQSFEAAAGHSYVLHNFS